MNLHLFEVLHSLARLLVTPLLVATSVCAVWGSDHREES